MTYYILLEEIPKTIWDENILGENPLEHFIQEWF